MKNSPTPVILASQSPRRVELLKTIIKNFQVIPSNIDETCKSNLSPEENAVFLSRKKELDWFLKDVDQFFPENHQLLLNHTESINKDNLVEEYTRLVLSSNFNIAKKAAVSWNKFEGSILK